MVPSCLLHRVPLLANRSRSARPPFVLFSFLITKSTFVTGYCFLQHAETFRIIDRFDEPIFEFFFGGVLWQQKNVEARMRCR